MSRTLLLTLAAVATATVASFASSTSFAHGGGGGHSGGGHVSGGGHGGGSHISAGGHGGNGGHGHVAHNVNGTGQPHRHGSPIRGADRGHARRIFRDGRWIVIDTVGGDVPDLAPVPDTGGLCHVVVYWDADFKGERWDTEQNQHYVGDHWNDQISSIRVVSGIWRFYWDADYGGEMIELKPGDYRYVDAHWNDQISSFRCVGTDSAANQ